MTELSAVSVELQQVVNIRWFAIAFNEYRFQIFFSTLLTMIGNNFVGWAVGCLKDFDRVSVALGGGDPKLRLFRNTQTAIPSERAVYSTVQGCKQRC